MVSVSRRMLRFNGGAARPGRFRSRSSASASGTCTRRRMPAAQPPAPRASEAVPSRCMVSDEGVRDAGRVDDGAAHRQIAFAVGADEIGTWGQLAQRGIVRACRIRRRRWPNRRRR